MCHVVVLSWLQTPWNPKHLVSGYRNVVPTPATWTSPWDLWELSSPAPPQICCIRDWGKPTICVLTVSQEILMHSCFRINDLEHCLLSPKELKGTDWFDSMQVLLPFRWRNKVLCSCIAPWKAVIISFGTVIFNFHNAFYVVGVLWVDLFEKKKKYRQQVTLGEEEM